jgi:acetaldehyde dehydrogenase/alcohol dehydrogenase
MRSKKVSNNIDELIKKAKKASEEFLKLNQEDVDKIVYAMAKAGTAAQIKLAKMAVEETGRGVFEDKVIKNLFASENIFNSIKSQKSVGVISQSDDGGYIEIAEPVRSYSSTYACYKPNFYGNI